MNAFEQVFQDEISFTYTLPDRIRLIGVLRRLQTPGAVRNFLAPLFPDSEFSPDWLKHCTGKFYHELDELVASSGIPVIEANRDENKAELVRPYYENYTQDEGVVCIIKACEGVNSFSSRRLKKYARSGPYTIYRARHNINVYYFYVRDREWGDYNFIRIPTYLPFTITVNLNGHNWLFRQLEYRGIAYERADNGLRWIKDPVLLDEIIPKLNEACLRRFCSRWLKQLPHGLTTQQREELGYYHWCVHQLEISLNHVFESPEVLDVVFEDILLHNQRLGSADRIRIIFDKIVRRGSRSNLSTTIVQEDARPVLKASYKNHIVKQYNKHRIILRTEVCINEVRDFVKSKSLSNWARLVDIGRYICQRVIETQQLSCHSVIRRGTLQRLTESEVLPNGQRIPGVRSDAQVVIEVLRAVETLGFQVGGFSNMELRQKHQQITGRAELLSCGQMYYRLRQFRHKGLIQRVQGKRRYQLTNFGRKAIAFLVKLYEWIKKPILAACQYGTLVIGHPDPLHRLDTAYDQIYNDLEVLASALGMALA
jgi:hypothetical protein